MVPAPGRSRCARRQHQQQRQLQQLSFPRPQSRFVKDTAATPPSAAGPARLLRQVAFTAATMMLALRLRPCTAFLSTPTTTARFQQNRSALAAIRRYGGGRGGGRVAAAAVATVARRTSPPLVVAMRAAAAGGTAADAASPPSAMEEHPRQAEAGAENPRQVLEPQPKLYLCFACKVLESA